MSQAYLNNFLIWLSIHYPLIHYMDEIRDVDAYGQKMDCHIASRYADYLKTLSISVNTHNKRISRIALIFKTLSKYLEMNSPWGNQKLKRHTKEESAIKDHRRPIPPDKERKIFQSLKPNSALNLTDKHEMETLFYILKYTG